ncbi:DUF3168 domain-containing protein [Roseobacteraceae bacterium S113]
MSYAISAALQEAMYQKLVTDADVTAAVGAAIYDAVPSGTLPALYITLGAETVRDASDKTALGARHDLILSVVSESAGFQQAKVAAAAVSDALVRQPMNLARGRLVNIRFLRAVAKRGNNGSQRRIDMTFRARVEDE